MSAQAPPLVPPPPPFETPDGLNFEAFEALQRMLKACGRTSFRMPTSCELFLRQYLAHYPAERDLLATALRRGVAEQVYQHNGRSGYDTFLGEQAVRLAREAKFDPAQARWAVEAWATALGRPPGFVAPPVVGRALGPPPEQTAPPVSDKSLRRIMGLIAAAGGFLGGLMGNGIGVLILVVAGAAVDAKYSGEAFGLGLGELAIILIVFALMMLGGICGGAGAYLGWMFGHGDERPWTAFSAACGAAFGTGCLLFFCLGPGLFAAIAMGFSAFGAAFTAATRGGHRN